MKKKREKKIPFRIPIPKTGGPMGGKKGKKGYDRKILKTIDFDKNKGDYE